MRFIGLLEVIYKHSACTLGIQLSVTFWPQSISASHNQLFAFKGCFKGFLSFLRHFRAH